MQGLLYNAFDDIETRMHGNQIPSHGLGHGTLRHAHGDACAMETATARQDVLKRPAMSTTATNAHNSLARTRVGDERKGDRYTLTPKPQALLSSPDTSMRAVPLVNPT